MLQAVEAEKQAGADGSSVAEDVEQDRAWRCGSAIGGWDWAGQSGDGRVELVGGGGGGEEGGAWVGEQDDGRFGVEGAVAMGVAQELRGASAGPGSGPGADDDGLRRWWEGDLALDGKARVLVSVRRGGIGL